MARLPSSAEPKPWPGDRRIVYIVDLSATWVSAGGVVELATERLKDDGTWDVPVPFRLNADTWQSVPDPLDPPIAQMLIRAAAPISMGPQRTSGFVLRGAALETTLRLMCDTGRCRVR